MRPSNGCTPPELVHLSRFNNYHHLGSLPVPTNSPHVNAPHHYIRSPGLLFLYWYCTECIPVAYSLYSIAPHQCGLPIFRRTLMFSIITSCSVFLSTCSNNLSIASQMYHLCLTHLLALVSSVLIFSIFVAQR